MKTIRQPVTRLDYCQYLLISQINYTLTHFAEHAEKFSHDAVNRYLAGEQIRPRLVWENVQAQVVQTPEGYVVFDDTVADKDFSSKIELVRRQYSGNAHGLIQGIGVVRCVYVNPTLDQFWIIDYRIYAPESDGKSKLDHVHDMLTHCVYQKQLQFRTVLMDTWYATKDAMLYIEQLGKVYYCPLKDNRQVDDAGGAAPYRRVDSLAWSETERRHGRVIKIKGFPKDHKVRLFRVVLSTQRTDYVVTNDLTQNDTQAVQEACGLRWKIEQFIAKPSNSLACKAVNVAKLASFAITSAVPSWSGFVSNRLPAKPTRLSTRSNMLSYPTICVSMGSGRPGRCG
jgi:hypothetical protein